MKKKIVSVILTFSFLLSSCIPFFANEVFAKSLNDWEYYGGDEWLDFGSGYHAEYDNVDSYLKENYINYEYRDKSSITELVLDYVDTLCIKDYSDLKDFTNLEHLSINCWNSQTLLKIDTLNLSELENLISLELHNIDYSNLGIENLTKLEQLELYDYGGDGNFDYTLDLSNLNKLRAFVYVTDYYWMRPAVYDEDILTEIKKDALEDIQNKLVPVEGYELNCCCSYGGLDFDVTMVERLNVELVVDKVNYQMNNKIDLGVKLDRTVQASDFEILFDASKLEFVDASIGEDFYNLYENGRLIVSWASFNDKDLTDMNFTFKAIGSGEASFVIVPENFATGDMDAEFVFNESKQVINIEKSNFIKSDASINTVVKGDKEFITGVKLNNNKLTLGDFLDEDYFETNYSVKFFDINDNEITNVDKGLGTGTKVRLYENDVMVKEYFIIVYGDTSGDGEITASDALMLIKAINKKYTFPDEMFLEAGKIISKGDMDPTAVDALAIIKHLNKKYTIKQ